MAVVVVGEGFKGALEVKVKGLALLASRAFN